MGSIDAFLENFPGSVDGFGFEDDSISVFSNWNSDNGFKFDHKSVDSSSPPTNLESPSDSGHSSSDTSSSWGESTENNKYSNTILRYISGILMDEEDDLERKPCMLQDCLKLQAAEKSFYDAIGRSYPSASHQFSDCFQKEGIAIITDDDFGRIHSFESNCSCSTDNSDESCWVHGTSYFESSFPKIDSPDITPEILAPDPSGERQLAELQNVTWDFSRAQSNHLMSPVDAKTVMYKSETKNSREKRTHQMDDAADEEGRGSKLSAVYSDDSVSDAMFDEVLLCHGGASKSVFCANRELPSQNGNFQLHVDSEGSNGKASRSKKATNKGAMVDLWTLLIQCAQAVSNYDQRNANELLKQIRQHSSPFGDGLERLAHYFASGLDMRLAAGTPAYTVLDCNGATAAEILKAYKLYITASPLQRMSNFLSVRTIRKLVENESSLHIIDFGICYGFQWPCLIHRLSERPQGPPKLRITGIELPQPGFRPAERVEETGRRLANYCRRFNVPFEYECLAQKWETIRLEDLKINRNEVTVVNCLYRLKNIPDETVSVNCPRDAVLKLIRSIKPNLFIHGIVNGTYNAPFFVTRFREALFHFSSLFDMLEATVRREDPQRLMFEKGVFGRDAMNVIACEGAERIERPETYKQWRIRNRRAGFKQLRLDPEILNNVKMMVKKEYHKDFVVDEDGKWVLLGWKGRIMHALSCWKPA